MIAFISGHITLTEEEFEEHYVPKIKLAISASHTFVVGDANGADTMAQEYLTKYADHDSVTVYHMKTSPRNNSGDFNVNNGYLSDIDRDEAMTDNSDYDIAWVREGREDSGTAKNIERRNFEL